MSLVTRLTYLAHARVLGCCVRSVVQPTALNKSIIQIISVAPRCQTTSSCTWVARYH